MGSEAIDIDNSKELVDPCIFCNIVERKSRSSDILENDNCLAIMSLEGHVLVIPKRHMRTEDLGQGDNLTLFNDTLSIASSLIKPTMEALGATGLNLMVNVGEDAGQSVDHLHVHLINRSQGDGKVKIDIPMIGRQELDRRANKIRSLFNAGDSFALSD